MMHQIKFFALSVLLICSTPAWAQKDYKASMFGVKSDGITLNTTSIQKAVDYISDNGGGRLVFYVGRYLTGTIYLKSDVTIQLQEGSALMASTAPYDYNYKDGDVALIVAQDQQNVGITGKGLIEGQGLIINANIEEQVKRNNFPAGIQAFRPALIRMTNCTGVTLSDILLHNAGGDVQVYHTCKNVNITNITVESKLNPATRGIVLSGCSGVALADSFIDTPSTPLALKGNSDNVTVQGSITPDGTKIQAEQ